MVGDTPETDAQVTTFSSISKLKKRFECSTGKVSAEFARKLERELRKAREQCHRLRLERMAADRAYADICREMELKEASIDYARLNSAQPTIVEASASETNKIERVSQNAVNVLV
jgi:hypothetical protein